MMEREEADRLEEGRRNVVKETDRWRERSVRVSAFIDHAKRSLTDVFFVYLD